MIPVSYSFRNIKRRPWRSLITTVGVMVVVFASVLMMSLARGVYKRISVSGEEENVLLISRSGQNTMFSSIDEDEVVSLSTIPGLAQTSYGEPAISPEIMHRPMVRIGTDENKTFAPINVRGVEPVAFAVHRSVSIIEGRLPENDFEMLAGSSAHVKLGLPEEVLQLGSIVEFEKNKWTVCGVFDAKGSLIESELWVNARDLQNVMRRRTYTFAVFRLADAASMKDTMALFGETGAYERFFKGWPEAEYYQQFTSYLSWVLWLSYFMVAVITVAGALIGINTMYTAIINRIKEISTQRILGFGRFEIFISLLAESLVLSVAGGILGVGLGLCINGLPLKLSYGAFFLVVDFFVIISSIALSAFIGIAGAVIPSIKGLRLSIVEGLRYD
ncbi:ABC transporter permease [Verrucomicrobiota bacterium]